MGDYVTAAEVAYDPVGERRTSVGSFSYMPEVSDGFHAVYHDPRSRHTLIGIRGTNPTSVGDLQADLSITAGREDSDIRFQHSEAKLAEIVGKYGGGDHGKVKVAGHSLGGQIVSRLIAKHGDKGLEGHAFNPGSGPLQTVRNAKCYVFNSAECQNQRQGLHVHTVEGDPLSFAWHVSTNAASKTHTRYRAKHGAGALAAHSMANFRRL